MSNWTSQYFGDLYHEIYSEHLLEPERALEEAAFASHVLDLGRRTVLDLACGYGRHARLLAASNRVFALDNNHRYLTEVKRGLAERNGNNVLPITGDMRQIPLADKSVDGVIMLFNSFGYFDSEEIEEQPRDVPNVSGQVWRLPNVFYERGLVDESFGRSQREHSSTALAKDTSESPERGGGENFVVLQEIRRVLKPGGGLLLEVANPRALLEAVEENPRRLMVMSDCEVHEEFTWNPVSRRLRNHTRFVSGEREESGTYSLRLYEQAELRELLKDAGFIVRKCYGDYAGDRFRPAASEIMLFHVSRPARAVRPASKKA